MKRLLCVQIDVAVRYRSIRINPSVTFVLHWAGGKMLDVAASRVWDLF
jgi:hypothetical protein